MRFGAIDVRSIGADHAIGEMCSFCADIAEQSRNRGCACTRERERESVATRQPNGAALSAVIPAKAEALHNSEAGQSKFAFPAESMDSRFRGNDVAIDRLFDVSRWAR